MTDAWDITIDGIPVGPGYGVRMEPYDASCYVSSPWPLKALPGPRRRRMWLTRWVGWCYEPVSELDPRSVIVMTKDDLTVVYDQRRMT